MGTSSITVAALATNPGVGYIDLSWTYSDPLGGNVAPSALDQVEVWAATSNNRAGAAKVVEGVTSARHSGVVNGATWYYWVRARNKAGSLGVFYPSGVTAGISGTEATATQVTLSGLTAVVNVAQASLQWAITDPSTNGLGYLGLAAVEVWAASTNDRAGASKVTEGLTSAVHDAVPEGATRYYWIRPRNRNGTFGSFFPSGATSGVAATVRDQVGLAFVLANGTLVASVASNALTVAVKTAAGVDPSLSDPVFVAFRNPTLSTGSYINREISASLSVTISAGSTLAVLNANTPFRIWVVIFDDNGTLKLGVVNASQPPGNINPLGEATPAAFVDVDNGTGNAGNFGYFYTNSALTNKIYRVVGYVDFSSGLATPGQYNVGPNIIRLAGQGVPLAGQPVQEATLITQGYGGTNTSTIPIDDTTPQISEGNTITQFILTPAAACNYFDFEVVLHRASSVATEFVCALFRESGANAVATSWDYVATANKPAVLRFRFRVQAGSASARTFDIRAGACQSGTVTLRGISGASILNGTLADYIRVQELAG